MAARHIQPLAARAGMLLATVGFCGQIPPLDQIPPKLVKLSVIATDNRGRPVDDLTASDFRITDAGKPQSLTLFRHRDNQRQQTLRLEPGEFSNRTSANIPHATLVLFDLLNNSFAERGAAQANLIRGLQSLDSAENLYLYLLTLDGRLEAVHAMSGPAGTAAALAGAAPWTRDSKAIEQAINRIVGLRRTEININARVRMTYRLLEDVAGLLAGVPGRKNIVWITHGVPISLGAQGTIGVSEPVDYRPQLQRLTATLDRIGVSIYAVQPTPPGMTLDGSLAGTGSEETLQRFAELTGGTVKSSGDIGAVVRQAMNDVRTGYLLGYTPPLDSWDGKFHKLNITAARKGVRLQFKAGYVALKDAVNDERETLEAALTSSFDAAEIGVQAKLAPESGGNTMRLQCRIDPADIQFTQTGAQFTAHIALQGEGIRANGDMEQTPIMPLDINLNAEQRAGVFLKGIEFAKVIPVNAAWTRVRLSVLDRGTHAVGSVTIPLSGK
jgi:VWFA-related protein